MTFIISIKNKNKKNFHSHFCLKVALFLSAQPPHDLCIFMLVFSTSVDLFQVVSGWIASATRTHLLSLVFSMLH